MKRDARGAGLWPTLAEVRGFHNFDEYISQQGGILSRAELLSAGWSADDVRLGAQYGTLHRLCRGWYGSSDLPASVRAAWTHGGPLACVSALEFLDAIESIADAEAPHVCRPSSGHRLRYTGRATIHWSSEAYVSGTRWVVALDSALAQAARCAPRRLPEHEREHRLPSPWPGTIDVGVLARPSAPR